MSDITSFQDLIAWQKAMDLADLVYTVTERFPARERFGLAHQMREAAVSIPSNVAEGHRHRRPTYRHHLEIALGSHAELETQSILAFRRNFIVSRDRASLDPLIAEVGRILHGLLASLPAIPNP
jgi:four helix bundle protein